MTPIVPPEDPVHFLIVGPGTDIAAFVLPLSDVRQGLFTPAAGMVVRVSRREDGVLLRISDDRDQFIREVVLAADEALMIAAALSVASADLHLLNQAALESPVDHG